MLASTRGHVKHQNVSMGWKPSLCQDRIVRNWLQASWDPVGLLGEIGSLMQNTHVPRRAKVSARNGKKNIHKCLPVLVSGYVTPASFS